jgi:hypothetical protein
MQATVIDDMGVVLRACVSEMGVMEGKFIEECFLADPQVPLKRFAKANNLTAKQLGELRTRAMDQLREQLAEKGIESIGDLL